MSTVHILKDKYGNQLVLTLSGKLLFTGEGQGRIEQSFPNNAAAKEHLERVMSLRRRDGFQVAEVREVSAEEVAAAVDELADTVKHEATTGRSTVTFTGARVPRGLCAQIVTRLERDEPKSVQFVCDHASPGKDLALAFRGKSLPSIKALIFDTHFQTVTRQRGNACGDLALIFGALPNLTHVFATGALDLSVISHAQLTELWLLGDPLKSALVTGLGQCSFPALSTLRLSLCSDGGPGPDVAVAQAIQSMAAPELAEVVIDSLSDVVAFLAKLTERPLPPQWNTLHVLGSLMDEDALLELLEQRSAVFETLSTLVLPLSELSDGAMQRAQSLVPCLADGDDVDRPLLPDVYSDW